MKAAEGLRLTRPAATIKSISSLASEVSFNLVIFDSPAVVLTSVSGFCDSELASDICSVTGGADDGVVETEHNFCQLSLYPVVFTKTSFEMRWNGVVVSKFTAMDGEYKLGYRKGR